MSKNVAAVVHLRKNILAELVERERELAALEAEIKAERNVAREKIVAALDGEPQTIEVGLWRVHYHEVEQNKLDTEALRAAHPKIAAKFTTVEKYKRLDIR
jgi:hypothetical protein